jgi:AhpC/TSA family
MYPHERSLVKNLQNRSFALIGVNSDKDRDALKAAMEEEKITWRSFFDGSTSGPIAKQWGIQGWPTLYLLDHRGVIRQKFVGPPGEKLDAAIVVLLREAQAEAKKTASKSSESTAAKTASKPATETGKAAESLPDDKAKREQLALTRLKLAKQVLDGGKTEKARERLQDLVKKFPDTPAAEEAKELLRKLKK